MRRSTERNLTQRDRAERISQYGEEGELPCLEREQFIRRGKVKDIRDAVFKSARDEDKNP